MSVDLQTVLLLLVVGMLTVFAVLTLIVISGRTLILLVNRFTPPEVAILSLNKLPRRRKQTISQKKVAAISAAVSVLTNGRGKIESIELLNP